MKQNKLFFIFLFSISLFSNLLPTVTGKVSKKVKTDIADYEEGKQKILIDPEVVQQYKEAGLRSIYVDVNKFNFDKTAFGGYNRFYLGAAADNPRNINTLVRAELKYNSEKEEYEVGFTPFGSEKIYVNGKKEQANPIYGKKIDNLILANNNWPIASVSDKTVCYFTSVGEVFTNKTNLNDADGEESSGIANLAANGNTVVAAVKPEVGDFGTENSGFALLSRDKEQLKVLDATTGKDGNKAFKLDLEKDKLFAIDQDAIAGNACDMYWDTNLNRLFVGLQQVKRGDETKASGAVSLLVGRTSDDGKLSFAPSVGLDKKNFYNIQNGENANEYNVVGFYTDQNQEQFTSIFKTRTMHTSTNKPYVVVNGGGDIDGIQSKKNVYALPLVTNVDGIDAADIGKIANKDDKDFRTPVEAEKLVNIQNADDKKMAFVGVNSLPMTTENNVVRDLFTVGDSVFACVSGDRSDNVHEAGIFSSTALLNSDGQVFAWTPWERVMGSVDKVFGAGLDTLNGNFWYLTQGEDRVQNVVKVTQWGTGESLPEGDDPDQKLGHSLVELLQNEFPQENGGVHQIFNFDEQTPGFKKNEFSMMVATGLDKIILMQTGAKNVGNNAFDPTEDFGPAEKRKIYDSTNSGVLAEIGPICCAEVSRIQNNADNNNHGWLFVGGYNGVAVLSKDNGNGWSTAENGGLSNVSGDLNDLNFKKLGNFNHVRKLVSDGEFLYVLTDKKLYKFERMQPDIFSQENAPGPGFAKTWSIEQVTGNLEYYFSDFIICNSLVIVATTSGLFKKIDPGADGAWTQVTDVRGNSLGTIIGFDFLSTQRGGNTTEGNLYVLAADLARDLAYVYRFQVTNDTITPIKEVGDKSYFYSIGEFRGNFLTDGAFGYHLSPKHLDRTNFLRKININSDLSNFRTGDRAIDLNVDSDANYNVGKMVRNSATGAWVVPGDWGIRVQE